MGLHPHPATSVGITLSAMAGPLSPPTGPAASAGKRYACRNCQYDVTGLRPGNPCPECGAPIAVRPKGIVAGDNLVAAPVSYLRVLAVGGMLAALGYFASVISGAMAVSATGARRRVVLAALLVSLLVWLAGVWVVTRPRRFGFVDTAGEDGDRLVMRWVARVSQAGWLMGVVALLVFERERTLAIVAAGPMSELGVWARVSMWAAFAVGLVGLVPYSVMVHDLAEWAGDTSMGDRCRAASFGVIACLLATGACAAFYGRAGPLDFPLVVIGVLGAVALFFAALVLMLSMLQLAMMGLFALSHSAESIERDKRMAERSKREAAAMERRHPRGPAVSPLEPPARRR